MPTTNHEREFLKADRRIRNVLTRGHGDPLWKDETFWRKRWSALVDNYINALRRVLDAD